MTVGTKEKKNSRSEILKAECYMSAYEIQMKFAVQMRNMRLPDKKISYHYTLNKEKVRVSRKMQARR